MKSYVRLLPVCCIIACMTMAVLLSACKDYTKTLPNGYVLVRTSPREVGISLSRPGRPNVISANIDGYAVMGDLVVGHVSIPDIGHVWYEVIPGYFVLDTKNEKVQQGMDKRKWLEHLRDYGITDEPVLHRSAGLDKNY